MVLDVGEPEVMHQFHVPHSDLQWFPPSHVSLLSSHWVLVLVCDQPTASGPNVPGSTPGRIRGMVDPVSTRTR